MYAHQSSGCLTYPVWQVSAYGQRDSDNRGWTILIMNNYRLHASWLSTCKVGNKTTAAYGISWILPMGIKFRVCEHAGYNSRAGTKQGRVQLMSQHFHTHIMCTEEVKCLKLITLDEENRLFDCGQLGTMALKHLFTQCGIFFLPYILG